MTWRGVPRARWADGRRVEDAYRRALGSPCDTCCARPGEPCRGSRIERQAARLAASVQVAEQAGRRAPYGSAQVGLFGLHVDRRKHGWLLARQDVRAGSPEAASGPAGPVPAENPTPGPDPAETAPQARLGLPLSLSPQDR